MTTTADVLRDAKALIADPDHWIKGQSRERTKFGLCFCVMGAIYEASDRAGLRTSFAPLNAFARGASIPPVIASIPRFNDDPNRTHADVMAAFDRAIAAEESA